MDSLGNTSPHMWLGLCRRMYENQIKKYQFCITSSLTASRIIAWWDNFVARCRRDLQNLSNVGHWRKQHKAEAVFPYHVISSLFNTIAQDAIFTVLDRLPSCNKLRNGYIVRTPT